MYSALHCIAFNFLSNLTLCAPIYSSLRSFVNIIRSHFTILTPQPFVPAGFAIISIYLSVCQSTFLVKALSHQCIDRERWYVTYCCLLWWPRDISMGSSHEQLFWGENGKNKHRIFWRVSMHYFINVKVEKGDMLSNDTQCKPRGLWGVAMTNYFWVKMGKNVEMFWRASTHTPHDTIHPILAISRNYWGQWE